MKLHALPTTKVTRGNFACPWCGSTFASRGTDGQRDPIHGPYTLAGHWATNRQCGANRLVSNPTSSKYVTPDAPPAPVPGAHVLALVERNTTE